MWWRHEYATNPVLPSGTAGWKSAKRSSERGGAPRRSGGGTAFQVFELLLHWRSHARRIKFVGLLRQTVHIGERAAAQLTFGFEPVFGGTAFRSPLGEPEGAGARGNFIVSRSAR